MVSEAGDEDAGRQAGSGSLDRIATVPNLLSLVRILLIPVVVLLLANPGTELAGLLLLGFTMATDWVDGYVARRTGQVSNVGKLLDPVADRLVLLAALITFVVRDAFPLWAALLVIVRDLAVLAVGAVLLWRTGIRIDVRWIGKVATFALMLGITAIAWANFDLAPEGLARAVGWVCYSIGIVLYYGATVLYARDIASALGRRRDAGQ